MKIMAINGSPRKKWNTGSMLDSFLNGAAAAHPGAETEKIDLYGFKYHGCISCFECKRIGGPSYGKCAVKDDIQPILRRVMEADAVVFGSPIYFGDITGMLRCFLERLLFSHFVYDRNYTSLAPKKVRIAFIYTMNVTEPVMREWHYPERLGMMEGFAGRIFGYQPKILYAFDTCQFKDYSKYVCEVFDPVHKARQREVQLPKDCEKAMELGKEVCQTEG